MFRQDWIQLKQGSGTRPERKIEKETVPADAFPPQKLDCFVACLPGLEPILAQELQDLGISCTTEPGGVTLTTTTALTPEVLLMLHMQLGTASHILVRCGAPFVARGLGELKRKVSRLPWGQFLSKGSRLQFRVTSKKSKLNHNTAIRTAVLDGINEAFLPQRDNKNDNSTEAVSLASEDTENLVRLVVRLERDEVTISVDSSSDTPIYKRGYRLETSKAPLREDIAYAMVYGAGWRGSADSRNYTSLLDPFCGSGTIAIEAASILAGLPPGRLRSPPFQGTALYEPNYGAKRWESC